MTSTDIKELDDAFATNYFLSPEYDREYADIQEYAARNRGIPASMKARIRREWQHAWSARTGLTVDA